MPVEMKYCQDRNQFLAYYEIDAIRKTRKECTSNVVLEERKLKGV
jgi:hypothetical protein